MNIRDNVKSQFIVVNSLPQKAVQIGTWFRGGFPKRMTQLAFILGLLGLFVLIGGSQNGLRAADELRARPNELHQENHSRAADLVVDRNEALYQTDPLVAKNGDAHTSYLPAVVSPFGIGFSVAGATRQDILQVVPQGSQLDAYSWDNMPNKYSSIQIVRACTYMREKVHLSNPRRIVFQDYFVEWAIDHLCWDPPTGLVAKVVYEPGCPYYDASLARSIETASEEQRQQLLNQRKGCLDVEHDSIPNRGEAEFRTLVRENPHWIWIIGNEPDGQLQDGLVDRLLMANDSAETVTTVGGPKSYARFFKTVYDIVNEESNTPRLVFCQATFAWDRVNRPNHGTGYCRQAFDHLQALGYGPEHIYALSVHQYLNDETLFHGRHYTYGSLLNAEEQPFPDDPRPVIDQGIDKWIDHLKDFEQWAASEGMGDKPLWLTEFGSLAAWCDEVHDLQLRPGIDQQGGLPCKDIGLGNVFYGRNNNEGLWGLQTKQIEYLARTDNNWKAAWWFVSTMGDYNGDGKCDQTAWIWGDDTNCAERSSRPDGLSRAGETYFQAIDWVINGRSPTTPVKTGAN